jgi:hypothetical protein
MDAAALLLDALPSIAEDISSSTLQDHSSTASNAALMHLMVLLRELQAQQWEEQQLTAY